MKLNSTLIGKFRAALIAAKAGRVFGRQYSTRILARLFFVSALCCTAGMLSARGAEKSERPNILLIYTDDHGWADLGAQGVDKDIRTPNLDRLAHDGVRFARGYVSAPQCVPSRAGVITGRYQEKFEIGRAHV